MVVRIRLARFGNKHSPFYNIVVAQARCVIPVPVVHSDIHDDPRDSWRYRHSLPIGLGKERLTDYIVYRSARGAKPLEVIGTYNPIPKKPTNLYDENANARPFKEIALDRTRAKYWLGVGAQPSDPAWKLMSMVSRSGSLCCEFLGVVECSCLAIFHRPVDRSHWC